MKYNFRLHFQNDFSLLKFFGVWANDGKRKSTFYTSYFLVVNIFGMLLFNSLQFINLCYASNSLRNVAASGYVIATCFMSNAKSFYIFKNRKYFGKLSEALNKEVFQPKNNCQVLIIKKMLNLYSRIKNILLFGTTIAVCSSMSQPLFQKNKLQNLPFQSWYPFNASASTAHTIVYTHQCISVIYVTYTNAYVDVIFTGFATFIALQCDLLCDNLRNMYQQGNTLTENVKHHWEILSFAKTTEKLFSQIYFGQFVVTSVALCMTLFLLTLVDRHSFEFFYLAAYQMAMFCLLLVPCWFSSEATAKSELIPTAAYECSWPETPGLLKKDLLFFIHMSQRPIKLLAIGFFPISVETFVKISRSSFSYFAVLNNLMKNELGKK